MKGQTPCLHVFNPGHEAALRCANAKHFLPRKEVVAMANDLAGLMLLFAREEDYVWIPRGGVVDAEGKEVKPSALPRELELNTWGWEPHTFGAMNTWFGERGVHLRLPCLSDTYYKYAHRKSSADLMAHLCERLGYPVYLVPKWIFPQGNMQELQKQIIATATEVHAALPTRQVFVKQPYTSSGRGVAPQPYPVTEFYAERLANQCERAGGLSVEPELEVTENWALEFYADGEGKTRFVALSAFDTGAGKKSYAGNRLYAQEVLWQQLSETVGDVALQRLISEIERFFDKELSHVYKGYLGVDMLVYRLEGVCRLHPCVEINLRNTMGMVAHRAFERYMSSASCGRFHVVYAPSGKCYADYCEALRSSPPCYDAEHRLCGGILPLTHPFPDSSFWAYIEVCPV